MPPRARSKGRGGGGAPAPPRSPVELGLRYISRRLRFEQEVRAHLRGRGVTGPPLEEAMARLHVVDRSGTVRTGAWAFAAVWDEFPYYRWLARIVRALRLLPATDVAYVHFARWRLKRRGCESGSCKNP